MNKPRNPKQSFFQSLHLTFVGLGLLVMLAACAPAANPPVAPSPPSPSPSPS